MRHLHCDRYARLADVLPSLVDERVGLIRYLGELERQPGAPNLFHFTALACNTGAFSELENFFVGSGAARDRGAAVAKAVGEAVERYCSAIFDPEALPLCAARDADFACAAPAEFALHSDAQYADPSFPFARFDADAPVRWAPAVDPLTLEVVHVPAAMVYVPYQFYAGTQDTPIAQPISTGLAAHCSAEEAAISGLCEVVERDAFTITWQAMLSAPRLELGSLSEANQQLAAQLACLGAEVSVLDITLDHGIPSVLSVYRHRGQREPALVVAAASSPDPESAVRKSLEELEHTRHWARILRDTMPPLPLEPGFANVQGQSGHLRFYCEQENAARADFLLHGPTRRFDQMQDLTQRAPRETLLELCRRVRACGRRALFAHVTTPDVAELGLHVVRAVVPGFHALFSGHAIRCLGGRRLWTVPQALGYRGISPSSGDNPAPHPYP